MREYMLVVGDVRISKSTTTEASLALMCWAIWTDRFDHEGWAQTKMARGVNELMLRQRAPHCGP
jgi:hypothetical protein